MEPSSELWVRGASNNWGDSVLSWPIPPKSPYRRGTLRCLIPPFTRGVGGISPNIWMRPWVRVNNGVMTRWEGMDKDLRQKLEREYYHLIDIIHKYDEYCINIKTWSISLGAVATGAGISLKSIYSSFHKYKVQLQSPSHFGRAGLG